MVSSELQAWRRLRKNPTQLAHDWFGVRLWDMQQRILEALFHPGVRRVAVKSCHGAGKTLLAAVAALIWLYGGQDRIVITTAPTGRQVRKLLWREMRRIWQRCAQRGTPLGGEMPPEAPELKLGDNWFATGFSSNDPVNMQGFHAPGGVMVIMDEANGVHPEIWDALAGVLVGENDRMLAIANPTEAAGPFFKLWKDDRDCKRFTISAFDTPNVKEGREVIPGMISRAWVNDRLKAWGEDSVLYQSRVLARFPVDADDRLIPTSWLDIARQKALALDEEGALNPEKGWLGEIDLGLDVARFGPDSSVIAEAYPQGIRRLHQFRKASTPDTAAWAVGLHRQLGARTLRVDATGLGAGAFDLAKEALAGQAVEMVPGGSASDSTRFFNSRAEWAWHFRTLLDPQNAGGSIALCANDNLTTQLTEYKWIQDRKGRIQLEPKDDLKKRIKMSPDEADASMYATAKVNWDTPVSVDPEMGYRSNPWSV